jgi:hypothetical protein
LTLLSEVHEILDAGIVAIERDAHPDVGDAMNMLGRAVAAIERIAQHIDEHGLER